MARRSQCSSAGDNPLDPNYLPPHYREEYRIAVDALVEEDLEGYYKFLYNANVVDFLSTPEIQYIQNSVQAPQLSQHPEQHFLEPAGDGSSDTYWPIHSDLEVPGLDLGWPQVHHFIEPTEVTTLVNPPEPDMPSIKEQARRLIKNAQQVIAVVMDMFTDIDMFADILNAAMRNVAVYILLDEENAHHFINMVSNYRVNLQSIQFLRVRTVSGITYHCRSGKSFKGQMMDRFLLTDCRAVLSGNYSFMWSFEKLHRCMAHLFLGQLVTTFDEEFRILFAQSQPLITENVIAPVEDFSRLQKRQYTSERTPLFRDSRKFLSLENVHPDDRFRHYDERMDPDWRMVALERQGSLHGPSDMHRRFPPQHSRMDPPFDQGYARMPMMENAAFKRHSYAEGVHGRFSHPFLQHPGTTEPENQGRQFHRGHQPYPGPGPEADSSGYDKPWGQDYHSADQCYEPGLPQEMQPPDNFDPVLRYLSSTRNVDFDQDSEKLLPNADLPFSSTAHPRRLSLGHPYACQTSPSPSNPSDQKQCFKEPNTLRKDPSVKQGLRNWRISSYLSACDNPGDEDLPVVPPQGPDPFEEPSNLVEQTGPGMDLPTSKIPNVREFKIPAIPRASQMPNYIKTTVREQPKKSPDEPTNKTTPTPSESSSTAEGEKAEEAEQKEPKTVGLRREESFRRNYNAAMPRSSRLRSSLIFSSLEQQHTSQDTKSAAGQPDEGSEVNEAEQTSLPFLSQVLGKRRPAREPFEWSRYIKPKTDDGANKADDQYASKEERSTDLVENSKAQETPKLPDSEKIESSPSMPRSKASEAALPKTDQPVQPPKSLLTTPLTVDMSNPDDRLLFFREMAAKRKAAKAAEAEKSKDKGPMKPPTDLTTTAVKTEKPEANQVSEKVVHTSQSADLSPKNVSTDEGNKTIPAEESRSVSLSLDANDKTKKHDSQVENDCSISQSSKDEETTISTDAENSELKDSQLATSLPVSAETESCLSNQNPKPVKESSPLHPPTQITATPLPLMEDMHESESPNFNSTSKESILFTPISLSSASAGLNIQNPESVQLETSISSLSQLPEQETGSELSSSKPPVESSFSNQDPTDFGSQTGSALPFAPFSIPEETLSSNLSDSTTSSSILSPKLDKTEVQESVSTSSCDSSQTADNTPAVSESTLAHLDPDSQMMSLETLSTVSAHKESDVSTDTHAVNKEQNKSLNSTTQTDPKESCAPTPSEKSVPDSENDPQIPEVISSKDVKADISPPCLSPSSPKSDVANVSDLESLAFRSDQAERISSLPLSKYTLSEACPSVDPDINSKDSQATTNASPQDAQTEEAPPSEVNLTGSVIPAPVETLCSSALTDSAGSVTSPEAEKAETNTSTLCPSGAPTVAKQVTTDSNKTPVLPSTETSHQTEPTSKLPTEPTPTLEGPPLESPVPAENNKLDQQSEESKVNELPNKKPEDTEVTNKVNKSPTQESIKSDLVNQNSCSESTEITPEEVPVSPQSKQPKSTLSRYHSSTANVLSSSNLRDDTKLLLEQISANSQSRNEATKESPVTDDEKEDEADKNAKREKERGLRTLNRGQPKSSQEKDKLLERIQSMRKERKVYSRFEV
ncbi:protein FAM83H [Echeneis naucrates]|uniref:Protein FAM83H-like n=1 Tax=Echeneis naucrates TaxID=173247 RepID=A0A665WA92_ECHNA|nr:protein FAM83H-like [Echeneis naucrates]